MRPIHFIVFILMLVLGSCNTDHSKNSTADIKREIPRYIYGENDLLYQSVKDRQEQLGLDSLENGFHDLQIRVWCHAALAKDQQLIVVTHKDTTWAASIYDFEEDTTAKNASALLKKIRQVAPVTGWSSFSKKITDLQIESLPNQDDVVGYSADAKGKTYSVEIASSHQYRFYSYWEPQKNAAKFWQAKNLSEFLMLFETEHAP